MATAATSTTNLTRQAVRGAAWTLPMRLLSRGVGLVGTLVIAGYLAPADYGQVSAAAILTTTASAITTFGVGIYLVSNRHLTREQTFHATCWFLATGVVMLLVVLTFQGPLAAWADAPQLGRFLPVLAVTVLLERIAYVPERMLVRQLRFRWLSVSRAAGEFAYTASSVGLAVIGFGPMAIAWGNLFRSVVRMAGILPAVDRREWLTPSRLRWSTFQHIIGYGANIAGASIAAYGLRRWDNLLVSRYFGPAAMGMYSYAYNLADTPAIAIGEQISDVIGASFPHAEPRARAAGLVRACAMIGLIMLPLACGLGLVAPTLAATFFDARWMGVGTMLVLLSVLSAPRPLADVLQAYFYAEQRPRIVVWMEWLSLFVLVTAIMTIGRFGILWTCAAVGVVFVARTLGAMWFVSRAAAIPIGAFLRPLAGPAAACGGMAIGVLALRPLIAGYAPWIRLALEVATGALLYAAGVLVLAAPLYRDMRDLLQAALLKR